MNKVTAHSLIKTAVADYSRKMTAEVFARDGEVLYLTDENKLCVLKCGSSTQYKISARNIAKMQKLEAERSVLLDNIFNSRGLCVPLYPRF
jgi:hypothetical protein